MGGPHGLRCHGRNFCWLIRPGLSAGIRSGFRAATACDFLGCQTRLAGFRNPGARKPKSVYSVLCCSILSLL